MEKRTKIAKGSKVITKIKHLSFHNLSSHGIGHEDYLMGSNPRKESLSLARK